MRVEPRLLPAAYEVMSAEIASCDFGQLNQSNHSSGTNSSATMLMILISGLIAGPAVSL
jgi:hypothetical protein